MSRQETEKLASWLTLTALQSPNAPLPGQQPQLPPPLAQAMTLGLPGRNVGDQPLL